MKKIIYLLLIILSLSTMLMFGCDDNNNDGDIGVTEYYTVTFRQEGCDDVVKTLEKGQTLALAEIPLINQNKAGYVLSWQSVDYSTLSADTIVEPILTPNTYTVTLGADNTEDGITFMQVTFGQAYDFNFKPVKQGYVLNAQNPWFIYDETLPTNAKKQEIANSGTWNIPSNVTIIPNWERKDVFVTVIGLSVENLSSPLKENAENLTVGEDAGVKIAIPYRSEFALSGVSVDDKVLACLLDENGKYFDSKNLLTVSQDITLKALLVDDNASTHSLTFLEEGCAPTVIEVQNGQTFTQTGLTLPNISALAGEGTKNVWALDKNCPITSSINVYLDNIPNNNVLVFFNGITLQNLDIQTRLNYKQVGSNMGVYKSVEIGTAFSEIIFSPVVSDKTFSAFLTADGKYFNASSRLINDQQSFSLCFAEVISGKYSLTFLEEGYAPTIVQVTENTVIASNQIPNIYGTPSNINKILVWNFDLDQTVTSSKTITVKEITEHITITYEIDTSKAIPISDIAKLGLVCTADGVYVQTIDQGQVDAILSKVFIYTHTIDKLVIKGTDEIFDLQKANDIEDNVVVTVVLREATYYELMENEENFSENV